MNICFCSQEYPPETHVGGIGTYTYNMASALGTLGHEIHVITSTQGSVCTYQENGVLVHRIKRKKIKPEELCHFCYSYSVARKISEIECQFDIVHSSEFASEAFCFALRKKYPLVTRLATPFFLTEKLNGKTFFGPRPLFNWMEKKQVLCSDGIFAPTRALATAVTQEWGINLSAVEVIPNSVDISRIIQLARNSPAPEFFAEKNFLLYFGRLEKRKGVRILAQCLPTVLERFPGLSMVFIGSDLQYPGPSMKEYIKTTVGKYQQQLIFFDNLSHEKLFPIVNLAKIVILPSLWEAFGFVCIEAMALGRPVIATSGSGFEEIIEDDASGFLVKPDNGELLGEKIIHCLTNEDNLHRISEGARRRAEDFEVSKVAHKLLNYYKKLREGCLKKKKI